MKHDPTWGSLDPIGVQSRMHFATAEAGSHCLKVRIAGRQPEVGGRDQRRDRELVVKWGEGEVGFLIRMQQKHEMVRVITLTRFVHAEVS